MLLYTLVLASRSGVYWWRICATGNTPTTILTQVEKHNKNNTKTSTVQPIPTNAKTHFHKKQARNKPLFQHKTNQNPHGEHLQTAVHNKSNTRKHQQSNAPLTTLCVQQKHQQTQRHHNPQSKQETPAAKKCNWTKT